MKQLRNGCILVIAALGAALAPGCSVIPSGATSSLSATTSTGGGNSSANSGGNPSGGATPTPTPTPTPTSTFCVFPCATGTSGTLNGFMNFDQQTGEVSGSAYETGNTSLVISVELYINGPIGTGTLLSTVAANQTLIAGGNADGFTYMPASTYIDSTPRKLYAYMLTPGSNTPTLIGGAAVDYFAGPDAKGLSYFNANLMSTLSTQCASCHQAQWGNYYTVRQLLGTPTWISGGTATSNSFYQYASGVGHPGGNQCSGNNLCTLLQTWWGMDFGK